MAGARFYWSERYRALSYGANHPLGIPRVALTYELVRAYAAIAPDEEALVDPAPAATLCRFHDPEYVVACARAERERVVPAEARERHRLGTLENPYFPGFFSIAATAAQASVRAAEDLLAGRVGFNAAGGMHHARPAEARGFCFFNDPVLAVLRLRDAGLRVLYVDLDAHHGDGVEEALRADAGALTLSLHMDPGYAYPFAGGRFEDQGSEAGGHTTVNLPLPAGIGDRLYARVFDAAWQPVLEAFAPEAVVVQAGADLLAHDPLGKLRCTTQGFLGTVAKILAGAPRHADGTPRVMVTGGGGYHVLKTARAWCGLWGLVSRRDLPAELPPEAAAAMRATGWDLDEDEPWFAHLFASRLDAPEPGGSEEAIGAEPTGAVDAAPEACAGSPPGAEPAVDELVRRIPGHRFFLARR
jgi:acetoin utilization protein AcuC